MKKLMFAAAAVTAGICFADVTSANIVGYSAKDAGWTGTGSRFNIMVNPFRNVDGTEAQIKLKNLTVNQTWVAWGGGTGFQPGSDSVHMFDENGQEVGAFSYATQEYMNECLYYGPNKPGWYPLFEMSGGEFENPCDERYVPFGNGYIVKAGTGNGVIPAVTFSGAVKDGPTEIPGQAFCFAGNCTPIPLKVKDIKANQTWVAWGGGTGFQPASDAIHFFGEDGNEEFALSYASQEYMNECLYYGPNKPGWYPLFEMSGGEFDNPMGEEDLPTGKGFIFKTGNGSGVWPTITLPNPLNKDAE